MIINVINISSSERSNTNILWRDGKCLQRFGAIILKCRLTSGDTIAVELVRSVLCDFGEVIADF